jgi:isopentenyl diphosphate isomerase/L-lactate dehydrogenase-like FMN-dependent dehydrogenase
VAIALALGARAVLVGRPYVYGLALAGTRGVVAVLEHQLAEQDLTLGLIGCASTSDVTGELLARADAPPRQDGQCSE